MNIALIGYGKMGRAIERIAEQRGHTVILRISRENAALLQNDAIKAADVAIEFTSPEAAFDNVAACLRAGVPVISGSTGWNKQLETARQQCLELNGTLLHASNFSVGVNIFFEINRILASVMNTHPEYDVTIEETHHVHKLDAPSGTAITIAERILETLKRKKGWTKEASEDGERIPVIAHRIDEVPGTHVVRYHSAIDDIELTHTAHNRDGFATGAVLAAEFVAGKKGIYSMKDVLGL